MNQTYSALLALLQLFAGPGAGWLGSWLFDALREFFPREVCQRWPRWAASLLWEPETAAVTAPALSALIAWLAGFAVALLRAQSEGAALMPLLDAQAAALITAALGWLAAQTRHKRETIRNSAVPSDE